MTKHYLETAARGIADATSAPPFLYQLGPDAGQDSASYTEFADGPYLTGLPEAFVVVDENDVLRDEGEAYARRLTEAGVRTTCVRHNDTIHDFMMLNPVRETAAATGAVEQAIHVVRKALHIG